MDPDELNGCSQSSTQVLPETQETSSQLMDQSLTSTYENAWGRLFSFYRNIPAYNLIEDSYSFGRGGEDGIIRFTEEMFGKAFVSTISKLHFQIYRKQNAVILLDKSANGTYVNGRRIGANRETILCNNDEIALSAIQKKVFMFYDCLNNDGGDFPACLTEKYVIAKTIGNGSYGEVRMAYTHGSINSKVAVKILKKNVLSSRGTTIRLNINQINNETELLRSVNHPCIVKLLDLIEGPEKIYIIMELAEGGELFDRITSNERLSEPISKIYFYQLVHAIHYLHKKKITHRDIKPENILLDTEEKYTRIKLTDFGLSKLTEEVSMMTTLCGTLTYIAPELLAQDETRSYTSKVDMWSLGVVLFVSLAGYHPFLGKNEAETYQNIRNARFKSSPSVWNPISDDAKDLIKKLLVVNPIERLNTEQTLQHPWLDDEEMISIAENLINPSVPSSPPKRPLDVDPRDLSGSKSQKLNEWHRIPCQQ